MTHCTDTPISWLRLEELALGELEDRRAREVSDHLAGCGGCRSALETIRDDRRQLRALALPARRPAGRRIALGLGLGLAAAAAAALILLAGDRGPEAGRAPRVAVKGGGELVLGLVRERGGVIDAEPSTFRDRDRFKVSVTCSRPGRVALDVVVIQAGETFRPLGERPELRCGNRSLVPGAFRVTGRDPATVCVSPGARFDPARPAAAACLTLDPAD